MTKQKNNKDRVFRRKNTNGQNEAKSKGDPLTERLMGNDAYLHNAINDTKDGMSSLIGTNSTNIARIDRETNAFMNNTYNPAMKYVNDKIEALEKQNEALVDIILNMLEEYDDFEILPEQLKVLGLEMEHGVESETEPEPEKISEKGKKPSKSARKAEKTEKSEKSVVAEA